MRDKAVPAKADGGAAAVNMKPKKPRLTEIQKLQSAAEDQRKLRSKSRTAAQSGKEKEVRAGEESGKAVQEKLTAGKPTKEKLTAEKPTKEKAQGLKGQKGTENKVVEGGKKLKKGSGSNVKVRKWLCPSGTLGGVEDFVAVLITWLLYPLPYLRICCFYACRFKKQKETQTWQHMLKATVWKLWGMEWRKKRRWSHME